MPVLKSFQDKKGIALLPLLFIVAAVILLPTISYFLSRPNTKIGTDPIAKSPNIKNLFPTSVVPTQSNPSIIPEPTLGSDTISGCIISLRYDQNDAPDSKLKSDAQTTLSSVRSRILGGLQGQNMLDEILQSGTAQEIAGDVRDILSRRKAVTSITPVPTDPYGKFQAGDSPNFCFENSSDRHKRLGSFFYEVNPAFTQKLNKLQPGETSEPFVIYRVTPTRTIDYAWMIITRIK